MNKGKKFTQVLLVVDIEGHLPDWEVQRKLDAFREAAQPLAEHGLVIYRATGTHAREFEIGGATRIVPPRHVGAEE